ncbi:thiopurine S-methyltransferase [Marinobacter caseinilyticus]|uniref:thiopurine S-methyltransferase n=1 Tax=Marinobacter caseinilyticus TaxID=2692195 RepID=UPI001408A2B2|nr:thiopurine S-methyltransferase [Marinobacter caseinilyticus]
MDHEFWHTRWANKEIGFHEGTINRYLHDHWSELVQQGKEAVFVPLCGKAKDLWWLHDQGHPVLGVELSDVACKDFFEEGNAKAQVHPGQPFTTFTHDSLQLWCGDFFQLVPDDLKHIRLVYDRAALIALPPAMRANYVEHLTAILPDQCAILLVTLDYQNDEMQGPPFNVSDAEVHTLYGPDWHIEHVLTNALAKDHPFAKRKGLSGATESVFKLKRRSNAG